MLRVLLPAAWFGFSAALYIQTLFVPLLVLDRTNCSSVYWLSVEGAQAQVSEDFCADGPKAIRIVNTAPEIFLAPDQQKDQFELRVNVSNSVFSAAFSINDTEGDTEALERIPLRLTNADGSSINAAVFARFVFTNVEFSDTALMVLSIVAAISIIAIICILIYIAATHFVAVRLGPPAEARSYPNIAEHPEDDTQPLVGASSSEPQESIPVRTRPKKSKKKRGGQESPEQAETTSETPRD